MSESNQQLRKQLDTLVSAATPFGHMAQELLTGHPVGRIPPGACEALLSALAAASESASINAAGVTLEQQRRAVKGIARAFKAVDGA